MKHFTGLWILLILFVVLSFSSLSADHATEGIIMTVRGPIKPADFGKALPHEHILVDFIGADKTGPHRYDRKDVITTMLPYLQQLKEKGFSGFVECTPNYLGRDVTVFEELSQKADMHILACTGYYGAMKDRFVPAYAYTDDVNQLAARWIKEFKEGIGEKKIKPGFIKIGVDTGSLSGIDKKLVNAAAKTHLATGMTIACHTGKEIAALEALQTVKAMGADPNALIIVHAQSIQDPNIHFQLARTGVWIEYDNVSKNNIDKYVKLIAKMIERGYEKQILLSHDAGWYDIGKEKQNVRSYRAIADFLIPALKDAGLTEKQLDQLLIRNPARAFTIKIRRLR